MTPKINLAGHTYGRWKVEEYSHSGDKGKNFWNCVCLCGTKRKVVGANLRHGTSRSCGCLQSPKDKTIGEHDACVYVPVCAKVIEYFEKHEPDYFQCDFGTSIFETFSSALDEYIEEFDMKGTYEEEREGKMPELREDS